VEERDVRARRAIGGHELGQFGEPSSLTVRYRESALPVADVPVRFALDGVAHDSTLSELTVHTDGSGHARTRLTAGSTSTVFRVRVSAERAAPIYVQVSVGNMGFGALRVTAAYDGRRQGTRRVVRVYPSLACTDELPRMSALAATLDDPTVLEARFRALPAGLRYAVVGELEGPSGVVVARACVDRVEVTRDQETSLTLPFVDRPLAIGGGYDATLELDLTRSSAGLEESLVLVAVAPIDVVGGDAALYLDALDRALRAAGGAGAADALAFERETGALEPSLATRLGAEGPTAALQALTASLLARFAAVELTGLLRLTATDSAGWTVGALAFGVGGDPDSPPLVIDPASVGLSTTVALRVRTTGDELAVDALELTLPLGAWLDAVLVAEAQSRGLATPDPLLRDGAGCASFAAWVAERPTLAAACGPSCAESACQDALSTVLGVLRASLATLDGKRDRIELTGTLSAADDDGELRVDRLSSESLEGRFASELDPLGDAVTARLVATRRPGE
jgi:hypothetical protein